MVLALTGALLAAALPAPAFAQSPAAPAPAQAPSVPAQPLRDEAARIRALIDAGQTGEAAAAARAFVRMVTAETGFGVANARLTATPATGYGVFEPRPDNLFRVDEPVFVYVELYGFSLTPLQSGANELVFDVAFTLDTPDGRQITDDLVPMGEIRLTSYSMPLDAYFHLTYSITGAEGAFNLRTRVIDRASGDATEFVLPLEFRADRAADPLQSEPDDDKRG